MTAPATPGTLRRLMKELEDWTAAGGAAEDDGIERLGPAPDNLLQWEAVVHGRGVGGGYDDGRWLLSITVPSTYPLRPPAVRFETPVVHSNVAPAGGAVCLDLLDDAWTPAYGIAQCVRAVRLLLAHPETDSPLNVDVAALLRAGDHVAVRGLVELACARAGGRYMGP